MALIPIDFPEARKVQTKHDSEGFVTQMPVWVDQINLQREFKIGLRQVRQMESQNRCVSCWKVSWKDWLKLLLYGRMWLSIYTGDRGTQPPVLISIEKPEREKKYLFSDQCSVCNGFGVMSDNIMCSNCRGAGCV